MNFEKLFPTQEKIDECIEILNRPENKVVKEAFWTLFEDRNKAIREFNKLFEQLK